MRKVRVIFMFFVLSLMTVQTAGATNTSSLIFHEDFTQPGEVWPNSQSFQHSDHFKPCRNSDTNPEWIRTANGIETQIINSAPCVMVLPVPQDVSQLRELDLQWSWHVTDPVQDRNIAFSFIDPQNHLSLHMYGQEVTNALVINGQAQFWNNIPRYFPFQPNTEYHGQAHFSWETKVLRVWVNQVLVLEGVVLTDQTLPFRPALMASVGHEARSSETRFTSLTIQSQSEPLSFPRWKQDHPYWGNDVYDTASDWTTEPPTIARWGCALTSAANLLVQYGITHLPTGASLHPGTLNEWLKEQPDGYLGPGLLNWRAITRLAKWHNQNFGTAALEFQAETPPSSTQKLWLLEKLKDRQPVVLEQPNHFVLATGIEPDGSIQIHDPLYNKSWLSEYNDSFLSARTLTPSYTNLQGATIITPDWASPTFFDAAGNSIPTTKLEPLPNGWQAWDVHAWNNSSLHVFNMLPLPTILQGWIYTQTGQAKSVSTLVSSWRSQNLEVSSPKISLSDRDFSILLSWQKMKSPEIWRWHQIVRNLESQLSSDEETALLDHYTWLLNQASENEWLDESMISVLVSDITQTDAQTIP